MRELFFSLITRDFFVAILENDKIIKVVHEDNHHMHSENFISRLKEIFSGISFSPNELNKIFFLTGPGGQTGERVSFSFVIASSIASPTIKFFSMNSLEFQVASLQKCLSIISVGEKSKKYYFAVYQDQKVLSRGEKIEEEEFRKVRKLFSNLPMVTDFERINFLDNFLICKRNFRVFKNQD